MSRSTHENMSEHHAQIIKLKNIFIAQYKNISAEKSAKIINDMRIIHGCAIYDDCVIAEAIMQKDKKALTDDDMIKLSINSSILCSIEDAVKKCVKLDYEKNQNNLNASAKSTVNMQYNLNTATESTPNNSQTIDNLFTKNYNTQSKTAAQLARPNQSNSGLVSNRNAVAIFRERGPNTDELSIAGFESDTNMVGGYDDDYDVDVDDSYIDADIDIDNIGTTDLANMYPDNDDEYNGQSGGTTKDPMKPTLILYHMTGCKHCTNFKPTWDNFRDKAATSFPNLQVAELNVSGNSEYRKLAIANGVEGYPTVILHENGRKIIGSGSMSAEKLNQLAQGKY